MSIPKKIHYCWLSGEEMPALYKACVQTWKKYLKDYEFVLWDMQKCPKNEFTKYHLERKNWAFVSDYIRSYAIYNEGGIYLDCDFEVIKPFDDLLVNKGFIGYQYEDGTMDNAICGGVKGNVFFKDCMEYILENFFQNKPYQIAPTVTTNVFKNGNYNLKVYDYEYFYPYNPYDPQRKIKLLMFDMITDKTYAIHHWGKSWELDENNDERNRIMCNVEKYFKFS